MQIRWIAQSWEFALDSPTQDYAQYSGWDTSPHDDGWWVDDISVTGVITSQASPLPDTGSTPPATCPGSASANCNEALGTDRGYVVAVTLSDQNGDGVFENGETILFNASATTNPGGCANGVTEYRFVKNGAVAKDWSANAFFKDAPTADAVYQVLARCSSDAPAGTPPTSCTTVTGVSQTVQVYTGDGQDIPLTVTHNRTTNVTTVTWPARQQPFPMSGYDAFRGSVQVAAVPPATGLVPDVNLSSLVTMQCDMGIGAAPGTPLSVAMQPTDPQPGLGAAQYFLVGHSNTTAGQNTTLGRKRLVTSGVTTTPVRVAPITCP